MIFGMTIYEICWYFLIYSFAGWVVEVIYQAVTLGKVINRGFLNGPVCPVYGFGVMSVLALVNVIEGNGKPMNAFLVFLFGVILATAIELIAGWALDVCFHARWWDYTDNPMNFRGYICVEFSLIWGAAILLVVRVVQVNFEQLVAWIPEKLGWVGIGILFAIYLADLCVTVAIIQGFNKKLRQLDELRTDMRIVSNKLSETLGTTTIETAQKVGEGRVQAALAKSELRDAVDEKKKETEGFLREKEQQLHQQFDELTASLMKHTVVGAGHLLKAFPHMKHRSYGEIIGILKEKMK